MTVLGFRVILDAFRWYWNIFIIFKDKPFWVFRDWFENQCSFRISFRSKPKMDQFKEDYITVVFKFDSLFLSFKIQMPPRNLRLANNTCDKDMWQVTQSFNREVKWDMVLIRFIWNMQFTVIGKPLGCSC